MVREIGTFNGVTVYSDKTLDGFDGDVLTFTDGSTCNVSTKETVNKGRGTISFEGGDDGSNEVVTKGPWTFTQDTVLVRNVRAVVKVVPYAGSQIRVTATGQDRSVRKISVSEIGKQVVIDGPAGASSGGFRFVGSFGGFRQRFRNVNFSIGDDGDNTTVTVQVPRGVTIVTEGNNHRLEIGDIEGNLDAGNSGSGNVFVGRVKNAKLDNSGVGNIVVDFVDGTLTIDNSSTGGITVKAGQVTTLSIDNSGVGDVNATFGGQPVVEKLDNSSTGGITVNGRIVSPTIDNSGVGNIVVDFVDGTLTIDNSSTGGITVKAGQVTTLSIDNSGVGDVKFGGRAQTASLEVSSMGGIDVAYVEQRPYKDRSGMGSIRVRNWQR